MEYKLQEDGIQSRRLSWLQASEGSSKLFQPEGFGDSMTLRFLKEVQKNIINTNPNLVKHK